METPFANSPFWAFFNSNGKGEDLIFEGIEDQFVVNNITDSLDWNSFQNFIDQHQGKHIVLALSYDLKNDIEAVSTEKPLCNFFPKLLAIVPKKSGEVVADSFLIKWDGIAQHDSALLSHNLKQIIDNQSFNVELAQSKNQYIKHANALLKAIQLGNLYEVNFCIDFFSKNCDINPWQLYKNLNSKTLAPYSSCFNYKQHWLLSASPELFLSKTGNQITSSPIKGTVARGTNALQDLERIKQLRESEKERAENIMIVDLVRNDFAKIAEKGSVFVSELCEIKSFKTVHHLVSTVTGKLKPDTSFSEILKATFPMGSMTGAPKIAAMQHADAAENSARGIYSGSVGYIKPNGDFSLNVVIRSLLYNQSKQYLSFKTGSALTAACNPENEFAECLVKAKALIESLNGKLIS